MTKAQAGISVSNPDAYRETTFRLLGDRNPLEVLAHTESTFAGVVRWYSAAALRTRSFEGKWTADEVIGHLVDSEWVYGYRLRLILCEDSPAIQGTNQNSWVVGQQHNKRESESLAVTLQVMAGHDLSHLDQIARCIQAACRREQDRA